MLLVEVRENKKIDLSNRFVLYTVEFLSGDPDALLERSTAFSEFAEIDHFDRKSGVLVMGFVSSLGESEVLYLCDEFKKQVESTMGSRLTYKVKAISL